MPSYRKLKAQAAKLISKDTSKLEKSLDIFNQMTTAEYTPILELRPLPSISKQRNTVVPEGGNVTVDTTSGEIVINGTAEKTTLYSRKRGRYLPGLVGLPGIGVRFPDSSTGVYEFGYGDSVGNRFGLEVNEGEWYTFIESAGNRYYRNPRSNWKDPLDGTGPSGITLDDSKGFVFRAPFGWYGYLSVKFTIAVAGSDDDSLIEIDNSGHDNDGVSIVQPDLPIFAEATNGSLYVGGRQYGVFGRYKPEFRITSPNQVTKTVGETFEPVASFKFKEDGTDKWLGIPVFLDSVSLSTDAQIEYAIYTDTTLTGFSFGTPPGIESEETVLVFDQSSTSYSGGYRLYSDNLVAGRGSAQNSADNALSNVAIPSGSNVTLVARAVSGTATVSAILRLREEW